ncbi:DUF962 domain-containing protein [Limibacillus halophilus]|uniref:DUF962 domain-containing protein n=1 Tax=Limibacillus halophilus TaxID=1579333 RepID=A0A839SUJ8_9PROT|nr:DUF962 domain-containing protein [Limibacillus halophilus]MBB3066461.1 hypothetical protein [Limibacillus halophilus]
MAEKLQNYAAFWPYYLSEHQSARSRRLHFIGTALGLCLVFLALATQTWWLLVAALVSGYTFAWIGHAFVERNKPATFTYPFWSLLSDFRMFFLWMTGRLEQEYVRLGIDQRP